MTRSIFKSIFFGALFGAAVFFVPWFLFKALFFFLFIGFIFRMIWWRGYRWGRWNKHAYSYQVLLADKIRSMSHEEYEQFKNQYAGHGHHHGCYGGYRGRYHEKWNCEHPDKNNESKSDSEKN